MILLDQIFIKLNCYQNKWKKTKNKSNLKARKINHKKVDLKINKNKLNPKDKIWLKKWTNGQVLNTIGLKLYLNI